MWAALLLHVKVTVWLTCALVAFAKGGATQAEVDLAVLKTTGTGVITVECSVHLYIQEDYGSGDAEDDGFEFFECQEDNGKVYYVKDDDVADSLVSGSRYSLTLEQIVAPTHPPEPYDPYPWQANNDPVYKIVGHTSMLMHVSEVAKQRRHKYGMKSQGMHKQMDVLQIRCEYNDAKPSGSESSLETDLVGSPRDFPTNSFPGSMADMVTHASYGRLTLPKAKTKVVTVKMGMNWAGVTGCPVNDIAARAKEAVKAQFPSIDPGRWTFREFFIPTSPNGGCTWGGLAQVGCGHPSLLPHPGGCHAWYRVTGPFVRAHELGHNLGLLHAGGPAGKTFVEYGDPEASMGASYRFSSYTAGAREQMGILQDSEVYTFTREPATVVIQTISLPPGQAGAQAIAIRIPCPKCVPKVAAHKSVVGGYIWVQFRGDEGYSAIKRSGLNPTYQNKVYVHLHRRWTNKLYGKGSEMWAKLDIGESYQPPGLPYEIFACGIKGDLATIGIGAPGAKTAACSNTGPPPKPLCEDDRSLWNAGMGKCSTYAVGGTNHGTCSRDQDNGFLAEQVCEECQVCEQVASWSMSSTAMTCRNYGSILLPPPTTQTVEACAAKCQTTTGCVGFGMNTQKACALYKGVCDYSFDQRVNTYVITTKMSGWRIVAPTSGSGWAWNVKRVKFLMANGEVTGRSTGCSFIESGSYPAPIYTPDNAFRANGNMWGGRKQGGIFYIGVVCPEGQMSVEKVQVQQVDTGTHSATTIKVQKLVQGSWIDVTVDTNARKTGIQTLYSATLGWRVMAPTSSSGWAWNVKRVKFLMADGEVTGSSTGCSYIESGSYDSKSFSPDNAFRDNGYMWGGRLDRETRHFFLGITCKKSLPVQKVMFKQFSSHYAMEVRVQKLLHGRWTTVAVSKKTPNDGMVTLWRSKTCGGTAQGASCVFPFDYQGTQYTTCTSANHNQMWCYTDASKHWGNCDCDDAVKELSLLFKYPISAMVIAMLASVVAAAWAVNVCKIVFHGRANRWSPEYTSLLA